MSQRYANGGSAHLCLQCKYPGYTGGLVIGSYSGSGFEFVPPRPVRGFRSLNIFCAQDESIWDQESAQEYTYGWSENFGTGPDGERLEYVSGNVVERGPQRVVLTARNQGGCYQVDKRLLWPSKADFLLVSTQITNICRKPLRFDFWTGDDPWIGKYRSSEGDVGYTNAGLVRMETRVDPTVFRYGGVYDLGNTKAEEKEGSFSGAANFVMPAPNQPPPDRVYFGNRFVHHDGEIRPNRTLDNKTMLAFNLGWVDVDLAPQEDFVRVFALGMAESNGKAEPPRAPEIPQELWDSFDRPNASTFRFDRERIELELTAAELHVTGHYVLANDGSQPAQLGIHYPLPTDENHPAPDFVELDGSRVKANESGARFPVSIPGKGSVAFTVTYRQRHTTNSATYIVTSAARWKHPIRVAEFVVRYPKSLREVVVNYPADSVRTLGDRVEYQFKKTHFAPKHDVRITWR